MGMLDLDEITNTSHPEKTDHARVPWLCLEGYSAAATFHMHRTHSICCNLLSFCARTPTISLTFDPRQTLLTLLGNLCQIINVQEGKIADYGMVTLQAKSAPHTRTILL